MGPGHFRRIAALFCALVLAGQADAWEISQPETPVPGAPGVLQTRWVSERAPGGPHDRIQLHRYRTRGARDAVLLYLPGTNMNGAVAVSNEDHNLWLFLANRGVEVYALDYRTHFVPAQGLEDTAFMRAWGLAAFVADARAAAELARRESGSDRLFVSGFSRGVTLAYALSCSEPASGIGGLIAFDGTFKNHAPSEKFDYDAGLAKLADSGRWASDVSGRMGWDKRHALMAAAATDPAGPALDPGFASIGDQVSHILYNAWRPGGLANPLGGFSDVQVLARLLDGYDRYYPSIQNVEGRSIAEHADDPRTELDDRWGELEIPILYFGATGMGPGWLVNGIYSAGESGSKDVTIHVLEGYGHLDVIVGEKSRGDVFEPALTWMRERTARPSGVSSR